MNKAEFRILNERRGALIDKKYLGRWLTPNEEAELERLQKIVGDYVNEHCPMPELPKDLLDRVAELEKKYPPKE